MPRYRRSTLDLPEGEHPKEYEWKKFFAININKAISERKRVVEVDVERLAGLCNYILELEEKYDTVSHYLGEVVSNAR
mgnify:CR=1 FL=1